MTRKIRKLFTVTLLAFVAIGLACSGASFGGSNATEGGNIRLQGSGASFPKPIYEKWMSEYHKIKPSVTIDYQSTGSGAGQKAIIEHTVDFGASDDPMKDEDMAKADGKLVHIPTVLGAVVLTYNVEGINKPLKLTPETIAGIYLGDITKWNDPKLKADNADIALPDADILPVYRADSSGTTAVFTDYLSKTVPAFKEKIGSSKQPNWVKGVGTGAPRNDGVMGQVKQTPNTIGYVEIAYAKANNLPTALIKNKAGNFVPATIDNVSAAAAGSAGSMPEDLRMRITNADGADSYPISSYTYILLYQNQKDPVKGKAVVDFLMWALNDGGSYAKALHYAPLPDAVRKKVEEKLKTIQSNGKSLVG